MNIRGLIAATALILSAVTAQGATLGLLTSAPTIGANGTTDYIEFGPDGDLSMFAGEVFASSLTTLHAPSGELDFAIGFDLADPTRDADGGFAVYDENGLYLAGDLLQVGFRGFRTNDSIIELQFGDFAGPGASEWTDTLLMNLIFSGLGEDPFAALVDGEFYDVQVGVFAVQGGGPTPSPVPLPASAFLLFGGFAMLRFLKTRGAS